MPRGTFTHWTVLHGYLVIYKQKYNHTRVPSTYKNTKLASYVRNLRLIYQQEKAGLKCNKKIADDEREALDAIGFEWEIAGKPRFYDYLKRLVEYSKLHGHCNVPEKHPEDQDLADWCKQIRKKHPGKDKVNKLTAMGFKFDKTAVVAGQVDCIEKTTIETDDKNPDYLTTNAEASNNANDDLVDDPENEKETGGIDSVCASADISDHAQISNTNNEEIEGIFQELTVSEESSRIPRETTATHNVDAKRTKSNNRMIVGKENLATRRPRRSARNSNN